MVTPRRLTPDDFLVYSWSDIQRLTRRLGDKIIESGYEPEVLIGLIRGGIYVLEYYQII
jgi:hypoxanthine phosphoribosyltransferase